MRQTSILDDDQPETREITVRTPRGSFQTLAEIIQGSEDLFAVHKPLSDSEGFTVTHTVCGLHLQRFHDRNLAFSAVQEMFRFLEPNEVTKIRGNGQAYQIPAYWRLWLTRTAELNQHALHPDDSDHNSNAKVRDAMRRFARRRR